ncbi:hypothetical protein V3F56_11105 [Moorellaceae bacterium AZ2]
MSELVLFNVGTLLALWSMALMLRELARASAGTSRGRAGRAHRPVQQEDLLRCSGVRAREGPSSGRMPAVAVLDLDGMNPHEFPVGSPREE